MAESRRGEPVGTAQIVALVEAGRAPVRAARLSPSGWRVPTMRAREAGSMRPPGAPYTGTGLGGGRHARSRRGQTVTWAWRQGHTRYRHDWQEGMQACAPAPVRRLSGACSSPAVSRQQVRFPSLVSCRIDARRRDANAPAAGPGRPTTADFSWRSLTGEVTKRVKNRHRARATNSTLANILSSSVSGGRIDEGRHLPGRQQAIQYHPDPVHGSR